MTRKDYVLLANALRNARPTMYTHAARMDHETNVRWLATVCSVSDALTKDNARFDSDRFLTACGAHDE